MERDRHGNLQDRPSPVRRELINRGKRVIARVKELEVIDVASNQVRLRALETHDRDITAIAYRGEPFIYDYFYTNRERHNLIPTVKTLYEKGGITNVNPSALEENDLFTQNFKGLSLMDIENMEVDRQTHELAPEDIQRLNRMFRAKVFSRFSKDKSASFVLENLTYFATQPWTHPEIGAPRSLKKLQNNITAYLDYYTSFLTDFKRDPQNEYNMLAMLLLGKPYLPRAVGTYIPARLNITPSSAIKLYKQRETLTPDLSSKLGWRGLRNEFLRSFKQAYRDDAFPEDLAQYQHYSEEIDSAATVRLLPYMQETTTAQQQLQNKDEAENLLEQWSRHKRDVTKELMQQPKKRLEYQVSQDHPAEKITMIKNRDTFVFVMRFSDSVHLTLEIDKTGKLFGVPPSLVKAYPHVSDTFIVDILKPLLEKYKVEGALNAQQSAVRQISAIPLSPTIVTKPAIREELTLEDREIKPPKRKRLVQAITIFEPDPLPPTTPPVFKAERFVAYSEDEIKELLGPQVSRQQSVVDQILRAINNFEHGHTHGNMLTDSGPIIRLRAGDYRILMDKLGGGNYSIKQIVNRKDAY